MDASNCFGPTCGKDFKRQTIDQALACKVGAKVKENYDQCKETVLPIPPKGAH